MARDELHDPGAILLIATYELGHQPLALASARGFLAEAGFDADVLDISIERVDEQKIRAAKLVGISVPMHTALRLGVRLSERIRALNAACHVCFFGLYATLNADHLLGEKLADSVIGGEFEAPLVSLVKALHEGRAVPAQTTHVERLEFAAPVRHRLPALDRYAQLEYRGERRLAGYVEASRGCKHGCLHCPIPPVYGGRFFAIPRELVLADVRRLVEAGARHVTFGDADFLNGPTHSLRIVRALHEEFPDVTYDFTTKIEHVLRNAALFPELRATGALFFVSAVESLSDTVLDNLEKGHTRADFFEALGIARSAGITLRPSWVAFTPWTTLDDYIDMLDVVDSLDLVDSVDAVQFTIRLLIPPGSLLLERDAIRPHLGPLVESDLAYRWTHPDPRMDALQAEVSRRVEAGIARAEDGAVTFEAIRQLALEARDGTSRELALQIRARPVRAKPPRLTEAWFC